jgi:methyl-accepting chemotaxis protein
MSLGKKFMFINILGTMGLCLIGLIAWTRFDNVETTWTYYRQHAVAKVKYTLSLYEEMGYGGAIHNFKNYVLRGSTQYMEQFGHKRDAMRQTLKAYSVLGNLNPEEEAALVQLEEMVQKYDQAINKAHDMWTEGRSSQVIDNAVKIDDTPYLNAFASLNKVLKQATADRRDIDSQIKVDDGPYLASLATLQESLGNSTTLQTNNLSDSMTNGRLSLLLVGLLSIAAVLGMGSWLSIAMRRRLRTVVTTIDKIEHTGDLSIEVNADGDDEIGRLVGSFDNLRRTLASTSDEMRELAEDLTPIHSLPLRSTRAMR